MIYELMYGRPPYMATEPMEIFNMILTSKIIFPQNFNSGAKSMIKHLCDHNLMKRFGSGENGIEQIKSHRFFDEINWEQLYKKNLDQG